MIEKFPTNNESGGEVSPNEEVVPTTTDLEKVEQEVTLSPEEERGIYNQIVELFRVAKGKKIRNPYDRENPIMTSVWDAFDEWKRLDLVIRAVARLKRESLLLVGKGRDEKKLRSLGTKLLGKRFKIMSFPHSEMPKVYAASDLFTYATVPWESFGIVLVEAMGSGLPVVATDDPIRREIVGDAGFFVDPRDTDAYAKALREALDKNWGDIPRKQAEKFDWDEIAIEYEKLFKSL